MHRFFVAIEQIQAGLVMFRPDQAHQIGRVLRMRPGDRVVVLDGSGTAYEVALQQVTTDSAIGEVMQESVAAGEPRTHLTLYQSLLKRDKFEWVLQKGTEIGVSRFVPVITSRTLVRNAGTVTPDKRARWERIITEAAEQSRRGFRPDLAEVLPFEAAVADAMANAQRVLIAWEEVGPGGLATALAGLPDRARVALFVGPEGGYEVGEVEAARAGGARPITLGPRILRTETAALVGPALILQTLGDMAG